MKKWTPYADLMFKNANIYTMDLTISEIKSQKYDFTVIDNGYVAVKDGKIIGLGEGFDESFVGSDTVVEDVDGKVLMPGLIDSHMHAMFAGMDLKNVALENCNSLE